jgi:hypothetical protein
MKKKSVGVVLGFFIAMSFGSACNAAKAPQQDTANALVKAVKAGNFDQAKKLFSNGAIDGGDKGILRGSIGADDVKALKIDVVSSSNLEAMVKMILVKKDGSEMPCEGQRKMVKENGKWLFEYTGMVFPFRGCGNN